MADSRLQEGRKAGKLGPAVIAIVQDGRIIFGKTYGTQSPGGPATDFETSRFQVASITKLFTTTAIMQLVAAGEIASIHDPANRYLKRIKLRDNRGHAITIADLMTHRAGFEDTLFGFNTRDVVRRPLKASQILPYIPSYIRPAGGYIDYSNVSVSILGLIVEDVSGQNFDAYLKHRIFAPLGMTHSMMFERPGRPAGLVQSVSFDAAHPKGKLLPPDPGYPFLSPSGALLSSGADMARFIGAVARTADDADSAILPAAVQASMFKPLASSHPAMIEVGTTWFTYIRNGVRVAEHGGDLDGAHSMLTVIPSMRAGIFISIASDAAPGPGGDPSRYAARQINNALVDSLLGEQRSFPASVKEPVTDPAEICGKYVFERRSHTRTTLPPTALTVTCDGGKIVLQGIGELKPVAPGLFKGQKKIVFDYVAFQRDADGSITLVPYFPFSVAKKVAWYADPGLASLLAGVGFLLLASGVVCLFFRDANILAKRAKWTPLGVALLMVGIFVVATVPLSDGRLLIDYYVYGDRLGFALLAIFANLAFVLALWLLAAVVLAWKRQWWKGRRRWAALARRTFFTIVALGGLLIIPLFIHMNLLGWNVP